MDKNLLPADQVNLLQLTIKIQANLGLVEKLAALSRSFSPAVISLFLAISYLLLSISLLLLFYPLVVILLLYLLQYSIIINIRGSLGWVVYLII